MSKAAAVLITGSSTGIGATYAARFAQRGHDLVLVARDKARLDVLAQQLSEKFNVTVEVLPADLTNQDDLLKVERKLRDDERIGVLINNAGMGQSGSFLDQDAQRLEKMIALNVTSVTRLAAAIAPRLVKNGDGAIVNIGSVVGLAPELSMSIYGATKSYVQFLSQGLQIELGPRGVYVQAVLPAATRTELWDRAGIDVSRLAEMMDVEELVDAALVGYDRREPITIPPLHVEERWASLQTARQALIGDLKQGQAAARYRQ